MFRAGQANWLLSGPDSSGAVVSNPPNFPGGMFGRQVMTWSTGMASLGNLFRWPYANWSATLTSSAIAPPVDPDTDLPRPDDPLPNPDADKVQPDV